MRQKKAQAMTLINIVAYLIILAMTLSVFIVIATFSPDKSKDFDFDERNLNVQRELISTLHLQFEERPLSYWIASGVLKGESANATEYYSDLFDSIGYCGAAVYIDPETDETFPKIPEENVIGDTKCLEVIQYMLDYDVSFSTAIHVELGPNVKYILMRVDDFDSFETIMRDSNYDFEGGYY